jgi:NSS family neurotransmitter:Na+ symporter
MVSNPGLLIGAMVLVTVIGVLVCSLGLKKGVEKINKVMMVALLAIIIVLAVYVCTLPGADKGLQYYLIPDFTKIFNENFGDIMFAALGQAFFTLSIGMGSMAIFGSYIKKERSLLGESIWIAGLDTAVAFIAGLIVIPAMFAFPVKDASQAGPPLIFETLPNIFNQMPGGQIWGSLFFIFMIFAAMSTVIAVFENIIAFGMDKWGWSRRKSCLINLGLLLVLALPCVLGFNILSGFMPLGDGTNIMDLEDFIVSNNILPLGSLVYVLFCVLDRKGWGFDKFLLEANQGKGLKFPKKLRFYCKYVLPILLLIFWAYGFINVIFPTLF